MVKYVVISICISLSFHNLVLIIKNHISGQCESLKKAHQEKCPSSESHQQKSPSAKVMGRKIAHQFLGFFFNLVFLQLFQQTLCPSFIF